VREFSFTARLDGACFASAYISQQPHPAVVIGVTKLWNYTVLFFKASREARRGHILYAGHLLDFPGIITIQEQAACHDCKETDYQCPHL